MSLSLFREHMPHVFSLINPGAPNSIAPELETVLDASYLYSRMLHKSYSPGGALEGSGFYRSFVCQVGSPLDPTQLGKPPFRCVERVFCSPPLTLRAPYPELIKKCYRTERGQCHILVRACLGDRTPSPSGKCARLYLTTSSCARAGEPERVGACLFPGLVKETAVDTTPLPHISIRHGPGAHNARTIQKKRETRTLVVRRAQVICERVLPSLFLASL